MIQRYSKPYSVGQTTTVEPGMSLVLAPNASPMTYWGTNTYILGTDALAIIDPGPSSDAHLGAVLSAVAGRPVTHILLTHSHLDHSGGAHKLSDALGAPLLAFGPSGAGRSDLMNSLSKNGQITGGEGVDLDFLPDQLLADGEVIETGAGLVRAIHTPGHMSNHMCFAFLDVMLTGDHVMEWSTSMVSPPEGDLGRFMSSCHRLLGVPARRYFPGHGQPIEEPSVRVRALIQHRLQREAQILEAMSDTVCTVAEITKVIYTDLDRKLIGAASRNVLAHLIDLYERELVLVADKLSATERFYKA